MWAGDAERYAASLMKRLVIRSYFSLPTDLASEMRAWPEFIAGEGYSVDLMDEATGEEITVRYVEHGEDCQVVVSSPAPSQLFDKVVGRVVCAMAAHSDNLMVSDKG